MKVSLLALAAAATAAASHGLDQTLPTQSFGATAPTATLSIIEPIESFTPLPSDITLPTGDGTSTMSTTMTSPTGSSPHPTGTTSSTESPTHSHSSKSSASSSSAASTTAAPTNSSSTAGSSSSASKTGTSSAPNAAAMPTANVLAGLAAIAGFVLVA